MSGSGHDPDEDDDRTVIIPAGQSGRPSAPTPTDDPWADDEPTQAVPLSPEPSQPGIPPPQATDVWSADRVPSVPAPEGLEGKVLGNYRVGRQIARGGLGAIYEGVNLHNPAERVAIKIILPDPVMSDRFAKMLLDEANALMRVRHDAVVPYRTYGRIADTDEFYLVLEFIDGDTLNDFYRRRPLTEKELFALARRLADGLQASHEEGLVHRDISPDNVLLPQNQLDKATLIDFGIAKIGDTEDQPDAQFAGKLSYAAPEQFVRGSRIGPWTDVYSLALLLAAAARGQSMPMGSSVEEAQEARREVPEITGVPASLVEPLKRMLEPHPADRPQSMKDVLALLDAAERTGPQPPKVARAEPPPPPVPPTVRRIERAEEPRKKRRRGGGWVSMLLALLIGGGAAGALMLYGDALFRRAPPGGQAQVPNPDPPRPDADTPKPQPPSRSAQRDAMEAGVRTRLATASCAATRVDVTDTGSSFAIAVGGIWDDARAVETLARVPGDAAATVTVAGETVDTSLCASVKQLAILGDLGPSTLSRPRLAAPDRRDQVMTVSMPVSGAAMLFEIDQAGQIRPILDLSAGPAREAGLRGGQLTDRGDGRFDLTLVPTSPAAGTNPSLLVLLTAATMPPAEIVSTPGPVASWAEAVTIADLKPAIDVVPRDGVPPAAEAPPNPPAGSRDEILAQVTDEVRARLDQVSCALVRLTSEEGGPPFTLRVGGLWADAAAMGTAAAEAGQAAGATVTLDGRVVDSRLCGALDGVEAASLALGPPVLASVQPAGDASRASLVTLRLPAGTSGFRLLEVDAAGRVSGLVDAASQSARASTSGIVTDQGGGAYQVRLAPPSPTANVEPSLLIVLPGSTEWPAEAMPATPVPLRDWAAQHKDLLAAQSLDIIERPGVPAAETPPDPETPADSGPASALDPRFASVACSMIRVQETPSQTLVTGHWGKAEAVQAVADTISAERNRPHVLQGRTVSARQCPFLDGLKPYFQPAAAATIAPPSASGRGDGSSLVAVTAAPGLAHLYLLWIDASGTVRPLIDLSSPDSRAAAAAKGRVEEQGIGRYQVVLPPYAPTGGAPPGLLLAVSSASPLSADQFGPSLSFKVWMERVASLGPDALRVDIAEYRQAETN